MTPLNVLIVDDEARIREELCEYLVRHHYTVHCAMDGEAALILLGQQTFDILILDIRLPGIDGLEVLRKAISTYPQLEVIMISGHGDMNTVIQAMRLGAIDYLQKPFRSSEIKAAIERSGKYLAWRKSTAEVNYPLLPDHLAKLIEKPVIGKSDAIKRVMDDAINFASFKDTPVLITGESGTGKEIIARVIHYAGIGKERNFVAVNCSTLPENLLESEFFGYKRGAFTGAIQDKKGLLEQARGGTLFLDEIGDMPLALQAKLLRVIEEKKYMRLGERTETSIDIRFLAATNHDPEADIRDKSFRADLYYRLAACRIHIPALRERSEDIEVLIKHFSASFCEVNKLPLPKFDPQLIERIQNYDFPGNIRELKNLVERAIITNRDAILGLDDFPILQADDAQGVSTLESKLIEEIKKAMLECDHNQSAAAKKLGISRYTLMRKLKKYGI